MRRLTTMLLTLVLFVPSALAYGCTPASRGQFIEALWKHYGGVSYEDTRHFSDVDHDSYCATAISWAYDLELIQGTGDGLFEPDRAITREELAVILRRVAVYEGRETGTISSVAACNDYEDISPWADDSLYWALERGYLQFSFEGRRDPYGLVPLESLIGIFEEFYS